MKKLLVILICILALTSCEKKEVITCYATTPDEIKESAVTVTDIVDATKNGDIDCAEAEEVFYTDGEYSYVFSCIKSQHVTVYYSDGTSENVVDALDSGRIGIEELDRFGISYFKDCYIPEDEDNVVEHEEAEYCGNTLTTVKYRGINGEWSHTFAGDDSVVVTGLLRFLDYSGDICKCLPDYTFETEFGTYGVNLSEGYARCDGKQVSLTEEQIREIGGIIDRQWEASEK